MSRFSSEPNIFANTLRKLSSNTPTNVALSMFLVSLNSAKVSMRLTMLSFLLARSIILLLFSCNEEISRRNRTIRLFVFLQMSAYLKMMRYLTVFTSS